jgi:hypothetical protein
MRSVEWWGGSRKRKYTAPKQYPAVCVDWIAFYCGIPFGFILGIIIEHIR